jgi:hypothetical protein
LNFVVAVNFKVDVSDIFGKSFVWNTKMNEEKGNDIKKKHTLYKNYSV